MDRNPQSLFEPGQRDSDWYLDSLLEYVHQTRAWVATQPRTPARLAIDSLLHSFMDLAVAYYKAVVAAAEQELAEETEQKYAIQQAIDRLSEEWMRLAPTVQVAAFDEQSPFRLLSYMVAGAYRSLNLQEQCQVTVIPHFGRHFNLVKFHYAPDVSLMGMPVFALQTPWEWSVIWHELAGLVVVKPEVVTWIDEFVQQEKGRWSIWTGWTKLDEVQPVMVAPLAHPVAAVIDDSIDTIDRRGWIEEMVEDACSILALGPVAYAVLHDVLAQRYRNMDARKDGRHPPPNLRLEVGWQLLNLMATAKSTTVPAILRREHGRFGDDAGAAKVAQWIWTGRARLVRILYNDWNNEGDETNQLLSATKEVVSRSVQEKSPLSRATQYFDKNQAEEADVAWSAIANLVRNIILDSRTALHNPHLGRPVLDEARSLLAHLLTSDTNLLTPVNDTSTQAVDFIDGHVQGRQLIELLELSFSDTDLLTVMPEPNHIHDPVTGEGTLKIKVSGFLGHADHSFTISRVHVH
ncbi:MAG: hypothetical protein R3C14_36965 [Caldilineaceae bacterium]